MSLSRSFLTLTAAFVLSAGFVVAHDHKKVAAAAGCTMPCCAHASAPGTPCPMAGKSAMNGSAPAADCPCCGKADSAPMACAHEGSAPAACAHHDAAAAASAHGSAPMACAHHDSAAMACAHPASTPAAVEMSGGHGAPIAEVAAPAPTADTGSAPVSAPAPAPAKAAAAHQRKGDGVKSCPISGDPVDPKVEAVINGRKVKFCCLDCKKEAEADPASFVGPETGIAAN